jgi:hypothetical protein
MSKHLGIPVVMLNNIVAKKKILVQQLVIA